jgi:hypothetical protein
MVVLRDCRSALSDQEIEIGAPIRLKHVIEVKLGVAACGRGRRRFPRLTATRQFILADVQVQAATVDIEFNHVAVMHQR